MTIDGNIKCFELSQALFKDDATVTVTSGESSKNNLIDFNKLSRWVSSGSSDVTAETLTITFDSAKTISRILLINHNFKSYTITPITSGDILDNSGAAILDDSGAAINNDGGTLEFNNVISLISNTPIEGISESNYSLDHSYYEFTPAFCTGITIIATAAQELDDVVNQEKFCFMVIPTIEVDSNNGTFIGFPLLIGTTDFQSINDMVISGKRKIQKQDKVFQGSLIIENTPYQNDVTLIDHIRERQVDFLLWPSGGKQSTDFFRFNSVTFRLQDIFQVQVNAGDLGTYIGNITQNPIAMLVSLVETI